MNERILSPQLLKLVQAAGPGYSLANPEWVKKFAELIVRECVDIANKQFSVASGLDDRDCWTAAEIKKHFGVEE